MIAFKLADLLEDQQAGEELYLEFLRRPSMSAGLYVLPAGSHDPQSPHREDEMYFVLRGRGMIDVGGERRPVTAGSIVFVPAELPHRFEQIEEELAILVFFAPAESIQD